MTTNIMNLTNITSVLAYGEHRNGNCKAVFSVEDRMAFTSMVDAAEYYGAHYTNISHAVRTNGTCRGRHFVLLSDTNRAMEIIMAQAHREREAEEKARRKEEKRLAKIQKEKAKREALILRTRERLEKHEAQAIREAEIIASLKEELDKLIK